MCPADVGQTTQAGRAMIGISSGGAIGRLGPPSDSTRRDPPSLISYEAAHAPRMEHPREAAARWNRENQSSTGTQPCPVTHPLQRVALCSSVWEILERRSPVRENIKFWASFIIQVMEIPRRCKLWCLPVLRPLAGSSPNTGKHRPHRHIVHRQHS